MAITVIFSSLPDSHSLPGKILIPFKTRLPLDTLLRATLPTHGYTTVPLSLLDGGDLKPGYAILINGRNSIQINGLETIINDGDVVLLVTQAAGG